MRQCAASDRDRSQVEIAERSSEAAGSDEESTTAGGDTHDVLGGTDIATDGAVETSSLTSTGNRAGVA